MNSKRIIHITAGIALVSGLVTSCKFRSMNNLNLRYRKAMVVNKPISRIFRILQNQLQGLYKDPVLVALIDKALAEIMILQVALKQIELAS